MLEKGSGKPDFNQVKSSGYGRVTEHKGGVRKCKGPLLVLEKGIGKADFSHVKSSGYGKIKPIKKPRKASFSSLVLKTESNKPDDRNVILSTPSESGLGSQDSLPSLTTSPSVLETGRGDV